MTPAALDPTRPCGILLAAGAATRFPGKLLAPLADGTPIAVASARTLVAGTGQALAVVRPGAERLATLLAAEGLIVLTCQRADQGMGASLAFAVESAPNAVGWVIALADMPFIRAGTVRRVAAALATEGGIVAPEYQGRRGHPVGFAARWGARLRGLGGDRGAAVLLGSAGADLFRFATDDPGVGEDIDTVGDFTNRALWQPSSTNKGAS